MTAKKSLTSICKKARQKKTNNLQFRYDLRIFLKQLIEAIVDEIGHHTAKLKRKCENNTPVQF